MDKSKITNMFAKLKLKFKQKKNLLSKNTSSMNTSSKNTVDDDIANEVFKEEEAIKESLGSRFINVFKSKKFLDIGDSQRVEIKVIESLQFYLFGSVIVNIMLILLLGVLLPFKQKVPYFVQFLEKEEQIVMLEKFQVSKKSESRIKEYLARDYVKKREEINLINEDERYTDIQFMSSSNVIKEFLKEYDIKNKTSPYQLAKDGNYLRHINIIYSSRLNDNQYQVEYEVITSLISTGEIINNYVAIAILTFSVNDKPIKEGSILNNPFDWVISDYSVSIKRVNPEVLAQGQLKSRALKEEMQKEKVEEKGKKNPFGSKR